MHRLGLRGFLKVVCLFVPSLSRPKRPNVQTETVGEQAQPAYILNMQATPADSNVKNDVLNT